MLLTYENNIKTKRCPCCGDQRPLDWFGPELKHIEYEKDSCRAKRVIRYRKYVACWRCREFKRNNQIAVPFEAVSVDDLIG